MNIKSWLIAMCAAACMVLALPAYAGDAININTATVEQLQEVNGIGPKTAEAIVAYRKAHGAFETVDDLVNVKGIGEKTLEKIKGSVTASGQDESASKS